MLKEERYSYIFDQLLKKGSVEIEQLESELDVSNETVRRDMIQLERQGILRRVRGGAVMNSTTTNEFQYSTRKQMQTEEKMTIAAKAAELVKEGEAIAVVASTTTLYMGSFLAKKNNITLVTNSIDLAYIVSQNMTNSVILTGGIVWNSMAKVMGNDAELVMSNHRVDKVFLSTTGVSVEYGVTEYSETEMSILKTALKIGKKIVLLDDSSKIDAMAFCKVAEIDAVDTLVTDWNASREKIKKLEDAGVNVIRAEKNKIETAV